MDDLTAQQEFLRRIMEADPEDLLPASADDAVAMDLIHEMREQTMLQEAQLPSSFIHERCTG